MLDHFHLDRFRLIPGLLLSGATIYASLRIASSIKFQIFRGLQADRPPVSIETVAGPNSIITTTDRYTSICKPEML